jgi:phosphohistidine swiveling domain-containing protein
MASLPDCSIVPSVLSGYAANSGVGEGRAFVVRHPSDVAGVLPGDVLVLRHADPALAPSLRLVSAVVVEVGGVLGSLATVARELGVPMVVQVASATTLIADGDRVSVDGGAGTVVVRR